MKVKRNEAGMPVYNADGTPEIEYNGTQMRFGPQGYTFDEMTARNGDGWVGDYFGRNATLRREDIQHIEPELMAPVLAPLNSRDLVGNITDVPSSTQQYQYDKWTHMAAAEIVGPGSRRPRDEVGMTRTSVTMLEVTKGWAYDRRTGLGAFTDVEGIMKTSALQQCEELLSSVILDSADYPDVDGLIDDAGNTNAGTSAWSNAPTTGDPDDDVLDSIALCAADGHNGGFKLGLEAANYYEAAAREVKAGGSAEAYLEHINKRLVAPSILLGNATNATGILVSQAPNVSTVLRAEEFTARVFEMDSDHRIHGDFTGVFSIAVMQANGVCSITGI